MKKTRFSEEHIVAVLKEAEISFPVKELRRRIGVSDATFYHWKAKSATRRSAAPMQGSC